MTRYLEILSNQRPFAFDVDAQQRTMFSINFRATAAAPVADWERELREVFVSAGAVASANVLIGPRADVPTTGLWVQVIDTGGLGPLETHDGALYERLSAQVIVRGTYDAARAVALAIWRAVHGVRNTDISA